MVAFSITGQSLSARNPSLHQFRDKADTSYALPPRHINAFVPRVTFSPCSHFCKLSLLDTVGKSRDSPSGLALLNEYLLKNFLGMFLG